MKTINLTNPDVFITQNADRYGRVFMYEGKIYRGANPWSVEHTLELLKHPQMEKVFNAGLVGTKISDTHFTVNDENPFALILEHETISFKSIPYEWSGEMFRDALIMNMELLSVLHEIGFGFKDGNVPNTIFDFGKPVFVDFGSILPIEGLPNSLNLEPRNFPWEWSGNFIKTAGRYLKIIGCTNYDADYILKMRYQFSPKGFFNWFIDYLEKLTFDYQSTEWRGYGGTVLRDDNPKVKNTLALLDSCKFVNTIIDFGANKGRFSSLFYEHGYDVVATDIDLPSLDSLYSSIKVKEENILPVYMDFMNPIGKVNGHEPSWDRLKCDVSMALALVHHLCIKYKVTFDTFAKILNKFSDKYSIVEFIPKEDVHVRGWENIPEWYTLNNFIQAMEENGFVYEATLDSKPLPRELLLFEKVKEL